VDGLYLSQRSRVHCNNELEYHFQVSGAPSDRLCACVQNPEQAKEKIESNLKKLALIEIGVEVTPDVIRAIKNEILGTSTFLVTETEDAFEQFPGAVKLQGNCRVEPTEAQRVLTEGLEARRAQQPCTRCYH
jgi:hypothetical protein